ncbi:unnamed protein product [Urochloa humidicola]
MAARPAGEQESVPSISASANSVSILSSAPSRCSSATCISTTTAVSSIRDSHDSYIVRPVLMPSLPNVPTPNSRRRRRQDSPAPLSGTADDFPATFHVPSARSVRCRLAAPWTGLIVHVAAYNGASVANDAREASPSTTRLKRKQPCTTLPAAESTINIAPGGINIGAANELNADFPVLQTRSVRCRRAADLTAYNGDLMSDDPMEASTSNTQHKRKQPCTTSTVTETIFDIASDEMNIAATNDFTTDFHMPSRRCVRSRLTTQPTDTLSTHETISIPPNAHQLLFYMALLDALPIAIQHAMLSALC